MKIIDLLAVLVMLYLVPLGTSFSFMHALTRPISRSILNSISSSTTYSVARSLNNRPNHFITRTLNGGIRVGVTRSFSHSNWRPLSYALTNLNHLSITQSLCRSCKRSVFSDSKSRNADTTKGMNRRSKSRNGIQFNIYLFTHRLTA